MKITHFDLRLVRLPYRAPIDWQSVSEDHGEYLLLRVCTDDGLYGLAETADKPTWSGTTSQLTARALREMYEPLVVGKDPLAPERIWTAVDRIPGWTTAKSVLDVALRDLAARHAGLPLWKHLGGWTDSVPVAWLVPRGPADRRLAETEAAIAEYGFTALKVKIGTDPQGDVRLVRRLRETFGPDLEIAVDANSSYTRDQAPRVAQGLAEQDVTLFEDPCPLPPGRLTTELLRHFPVPILVDKQARGFPQVQALVAAGAPALAVKLTRTGYRWAERTLQLCEEAGVLVAVGINAETGLGSLMSLHFHGAHRHLQRVPAENSFFLQLREDVLAEPLRVVGGRITLPSGPGLGGELDERVLERYSEPL
jgi:L-alanine-DL-glutamate epimerase-like enolase superfamily enzyme